jgi:hypothetical protein
MLGAALRGRTASERRSLVRRALELLGARPPSHGSTEEPR